MPEENRIPAIKLQLDAERKAHADRVRAERDESKERLQRLEGYINSTAYYNLHDTEKGLLNAQLSALRAYTDSLNQRVAFHGTQG